MGLKITSNNLVLSWLKIGILAFSLGLITKIFYFYSPLGEYRNSFIINLLDYSWLILLVASLWSLDSKPTINSEIIFNICLACIIASALIGANLSSPISENYVIIISGAFFYAAILAYCAYTLYQELQQNYRLNFHLAASISSKVIFLLIAISFGFSWFQLQSYLEYYPLELQRYYELLFLSIRCLLEFFFLQIYIWLIFSSTRKTHPAFKENRIVQGILFLNLILASLAIFGHIINFNIASLDYKDYYSMLSKNYNYFALIVPLGTILYYYKNFDKLTNFTALYSTCLIIIRYILDKNNFTLHQAIMITGMAYCYLQVFKYYQIPNIVYWQISLISLGYGLEMINLVLSSTNETLNNLVYAGQILEVSGGLLFIYICGKQLFSSNFRKYI